MLKILHFLYAVFFFLVSPYLAYRLTSFNTDQYFRTKMIPYPSGNFAAAAGWAACFWMLGISFLIHTLIFKKKERRP